MQKELSPCIVVTGAAGFIGSNIVGLLNKKRIQNLILVDHLTSQKKQNIQSLSYAQYIEKDDFLEKVQKRSLPPVAAIIHMGACSDTREYNRTYLRKNNYEYSQILFRFARENNCQFIYASSASVYGDGEKGYKENLDELKPLNPYGYYKYLFDTWVLRQKKTPKQWVGLRFFNVYGPHEEHKGPMASVIYHGFNQIKKDGIMKLFKSYEKGFQDGMQLRDFIYVKDVVDIIYFFLKHPTLSGIFNVGTGKARTFIDLAKATFSAMEKRANISFIDMPVLLQPKYQYFTQADTSHLRSNGYKRNFTSLEKGVEDYVQKYLQKNK